MNGLVTFVIVGTITLLFGFGLIVLLILNYQKKLGKKNKEMFLAVIRTQELEQQRIGQDLHDSISPMISAIRQRLGDVELMIEEGQYQLEKEFAKLDELLQNSGQVVREAAHNLKPIALQRGFLAILEDFLQMASSSGLKVELYVRNAPARFDEMAELNLFRIVQELVHNAIKYSGGTGIKVFVFSFSPETVQLIVRDNGKGMVSDKITGPTKGMGIQNIKNRVKLLKGNYKFYSAKPKGLAIHLKFDSRKWN